MTSPYFLIERNDGTHIEWARWSLKGVEWISDPRQADAYANRASAERFRDFYEEGDFVGSVTGLRIVERSDADPRNEWVSLGDLEARLDPSDQYVDIRIKKSGQRACFLNKKSIERLLVLFQTADPTDDEHG